MRPLLICSLLISFFFSTAQEITGLAKDETGNPLAGATVCLIRTVDSSTVKMAVTATNGRYYFSQIKEGNYQVRLTSVGYAPAFSPKFSYTSAQMTVPDIKMMKNSVSLTNINVKASKPLVEVRADKMILNVEGTINGIGSTALELLRKSPGIFLDKDDNITLAGKNGIQVYIDNRPTSLSGAELANYLKSIQSSQIEAIEIITNPSAKYDAAGNAGIINIRLVKNKSFGTNGTVNAGWNMAQTAKYNAGASLNYRNKNINIFSTYSYARLQNRQHLDLKRTLLDSMFEQDGRIYDSRRSHNFKIGADYFISKKSTIGLLMTGVLTDPASSTGGNTTISNTRTGEVDRILVADNDNRMRRHSISLNANYTYTNPKATTLVINADRTDYSMDGDQYQRNLYYDPLYQSKLSTVIYHILSPAKIEISSLKADYEKKFLKGKLALGLKSAMIETDNDFRRYDVTGGTETLDEERSNRFDYKENIHAGYVNYNRQYKHVFIQAGLRVENTHSEGQSKGLKGTATASSFSRTYTDLFPSAAITFNKNPLKQWNLTFSRRIDRPAYQDLNPFEFKLDEYTSMRGNINLRPQYTNSVGLTHTYKYKLNVGLNYSHVKDMFASIFDTTETSRAFVSKRNLATQEIVNLTVSYPFQYKAYSLFTSATTNYSKYHADFGAGRRVDLEAFGFNFFVQNSLKFAKKYTAELSGFFNAPTVYQGSFRTKSIYNVDAGLSRLVLKGRGTMKAAVTDIFYSQQFRAVSNFAGQVMNMHFRGESRQFRLNFTYRFGGTQVKAARQRTTGAEDEMKRVQQGGGMLGGN